MLEYLVNDNGLSEDDCSEEDVKFIKALIRGSGDAKPHKRFLFDIVNNKRNSVDVDKFDYIARDSHHCGVKVGFDHQRSMRFTRVIDQEICWNKNEALNLCQLFSTRFNLFKQVYTHKVGKSIELMLIDALCLADEHLRIGDAIESEEQYTHLTDAILKEIERSRAPELKPSQDVLKRIRLRDLYRCAGTFVLPQQLVGRITKENFTAQRILQYAEASELKGINADDIFPEFLVLSWCFGTENPIKMCRFHNKYKLNDKFEITLRVFVRFDTMRVTVWNIFERFIKNLELEYPASTVSVPLDLAGSDVEEDGEEFVFGVKQTFGVIGSDKEKHVGDDSFRQMEKNLGFNTSNEFDDDFEGTNADQYSTPVRNVGGTDKSIKRQRPGSSAGSFDGAKFRRVASDLSSDGENRMYFTLDGEVGLNGSMLPPPPLHASLGLSKGNELPGDYMDRRNESPHKKRSIEKDKKRK
ncbi:SAM domain and HD [Rhizoclosmatium sp. JEL0117]|nr:SAM domain and HD [Rhizoclosmatium sp. JEL0117]